MRFAIVAPGYPNTRAISPLGISRRVARRLEACMKRMVQSVGFPPMR